VARDASGFDDITTQAIRITCAATKRYWPL
jgi:hypothetical protein